VRRYFRADAAFASPEIYEYLEEHGFLYAIRLPSNQVLAKEIEPLLKRPVGRPPEKPIIWYHDFFYQAASWNSPRRVVAKVEWHQGDLLVLEEMDGRCSGQKDKCVPKPVEDHDFGRKEAIIDSQ
jgi:hypothetical protein